MIFVLVGKARCGKNIAAEYLKEKYGFDIFVFAHYINIELKKRGYEVTKLNRTMMGGILRSEMGMDAVAQLLYKDLKRKKSKNAVLVGPRSPEEVQYIRDKTNDRLAVIEIVADPEIRFQRRSKLDPQTRKEFFSRDEIDIKTRGFGELLRTADYRIENNGTKEELYREIDKLMERLMK